MTGCLICLGQRRGAALYHRQCLERLFGIRKVPKIDVELAKLHTYGLAMVGRTSLSGVQRKISLGLDTDRMTLQVTVNRSRFILKPATEVFPSLPENEHVTMQIARLCRIEVPPNGLIQLADGSWAYIVARFDRPPEGGKLRQEDFCQLALKSPKEKYDGSAELCARLVRRYTSEPLVQELALFRLVLFGWWTGNGDMHLKNFSLLAGNDGRQRLSPAYDLVSTRLVIPGDRLALTVDGKDTGVTRRTWRNYAMYCGLPPPIAEREIAAIAAAVAPAKHLLARSRLPDLLRTEYAALLEQRGHFLA